MMDLSLTPFLIILINLKSFIVSSPAVITYSVDFDILEYKNIDGRLLNGDCCSGYKSTLGQGICRGGNDTCRPYWKVCLTHYHDKTTINNDLLVRSQLYRNNIGPRELYLPRRPINHAQLRSLSKSKRTSSFKNFFSRIFSSIKTVNDFTLDTIYSETKNNPTISITPPPLPPSLLSPPSSKPFIHAQAPTISSTQSSQSYTSMNTPQCSIAYWTTDIIKNEMGRITEPIHLSSIIPINSMTKKIHLDSLITSSWNSNSTEIREIFPLKQNVLIVIEIWHKYENGDKLISRHIEQKNTTVQFPSSNKFWEYGSSTSNNNKSGINVNPSVQYKYRWKILGNVKYNELEATTEEACPSGFKGNPCKPICKNDCHPVHGYCEKPGECTCKFGWTGNNCSTCSRMPGCVHGTCLKPFECRCEEGWSGMFCDKPTCKVGCHPSHGYCEKPGECSCRFGYQGSNCTECSTMPGCQNGGCSKSLDCNCFDGWKGLFCSIPICKKGCDLENGWCKYPNECRCRVGWTGKNCTECVPYPGCKNGGCSTIPWTCNCYPGWGGITCEEKLDWCDKNKNPCENNGLCISVTKQEGDYVCKCPQEFNGKNCQKLRAKLFK